MANECPTKTNAPNATTPISPTRQTRPTNIRALPAPPDEHTTLDDDALSIAAVHLQDF